MSNNSSLKYFKTLKYGLDVIVGDPEDGQVAPQSIRFVPYTEEYKGDKRKVGYLKTRNEVAIEKLLADSSVEEISEKDFKEATDAESGAVPAGY